MKTFVSVIAALLLLFSFSFAGTEIVVVNNLEVTASGAEAGWAETGGIWNIVTAGDSNLNFLAMRAYGGSNIQHIYSVDYGITWDSAVWNDPLGSAVSDEIRLYVIARDTTAYVGYDLSTDILWGYLLIGTTIGTADTLFTGASLDGANRIGLFKAGDRFFSPLVQELGSPDSIRSLVADADGFPADGWHINTGLGVKPGYGRVAGTPAGYSILVPQGGATNNNVYLTDTTQVQQIGTGFWPAIANSADGYASDFIFTDDSVGIQVCQMATTTGADSVVARNFTITDYPASPGVSYGTIATLATEAQIRDGEVVYPCISWVYGTDTAYIYYKIWTDTSDATTNQIMVAATYDRGATYETPEVFYDPDDLRYILQAPDWIYRTTGNGVIRSLFAIGSITADDTLHYITDTLTAAATPLSQTWTVVDTLEDGFTLQDEYSNAVGTVDFIKVVYGTVNDVTDAGRDSTEDASGLGSPDTLVITGLTAETKYYFWGMLQDDNGIDTVDVDSITTLAASDVYAPDEFDAFGIIAMLHIAPDSFRVFIGAVDSTDYDTFMVRIGTSIPADETAGALAFTGGATENDTSDYAIDVSTTGWHYMRALVADELLNWSTGIVDSFYVPEGGGSDPAVISRRYDIKTGVGVRYDP